MPSNAEIHAAGPALHADTQDDGYALWLEALGYTADDGPIDRFLEACAIAADWERESVMLDRAGL